MNENWQRSLKTAIDDGGFDRLFFSIANFKLGHESKLIAKELIETGYNLRQAIKQG